MSEQRISRWMGLLGLCTAVILFVGFAVLGGNPPNGSAAGIRVVTYYNAHVVQSYASLFVVGAAIALLLLYVSHLRTVLVDGEKGNRLWSNVAYAAGVILVGGVVVAGAFQLVLILAARNHLTGIAQTMNFFAQNDELLFIFGVCVLMLGTGIGILSSSLPRWTGIVAVVIGVAVPLGPIGFFGVLAFLVWLPVFGFVLASRAKKETNAGITPVAAAA